ncbi:MAG: hypothetical protein KDA44_16365 [Planctomycetales bacterium]|nr:hypothetical protein [Planctomycetales bacterium]
MKTTTTLAAVALLASFAPIANAQYGNYYGYHHRSTALGDAYSGASELVRAEGAYLKDEADAALTWLEVDRGREAFRYEMGEWRQQVELRRQREIQDKAEARRARQQQDAQVRSVSAQELARDIRDGMPVWPAALREPQYSGSLSMIESILRNWDATTAPMANVYRSALSTELGVLENRVAADDSIGFVYRVEAVRTLRLLRELTEANAAAPAPQLAMR